MKGWSRCLYRSVIQGTVRNVHFYAAPAAATQSFDPSLLNIMPPENCRAHGRSNMVVLSCYNTIDSCQIFICAQSSLGWPDKSPRVLGRQFESSSAFFATCCPRWHVCHYKTVVDGCLTLTVSFGIFPSIMYTRDGLAH